MNSMARNAEIWSGGFLDPLRLDRHIRPPLTQGRMAEWLCRGLQIPVQRFDSASGLQRCANSTRLERAQHDRTYFRWRPSPTCLRLRVSGVGVTDCRPRKITLLALRDRLCYKAGPVALDREWGPDPR